LVGLTPVIESRCDRKVSATTAVSVDEKGEGEITGPPPVRWVKALGAAGVVGLFTTATPVVTRFNGGG